MFYKVPNFPRSRNAGAFGDEGARITIGLLGKEHARSRSNFMNEEGQRLSRCWHIIWEERKLYLALFPPRADFYARSTIATSRSLAESTNDNYNNDNSGGMEEWTKNRKEARGRRARPASQRTPPKKLPDKLQYKQPEKG